MFDDSDGDLGNSADYAGEILAEAIAVAEKNTYTYNYNYNLREKVADAVSAHRPDSVIRISIQEAEKLIEPTQSKYYPHAVRWLAKAKQAYLQSGRNAEWLAYFTRLKTTYARCPSLQKELAKLWVYLLNALVR